ncbi:hypothetical protein [Dehalogenimonas etheniformans]|uniref:Uncharacterized protein n=1 Tax=Dehalogenimonas etheniformans TaxID=1536648 RepID=A0A2P5P8P0_9CHLR|nr:hypothetical protein [Dehalogenimonas etheniformans]PPD58664.1 hypothetical protein JP09_001965 [Dehalogenimonas etheniformans]QNT76564.1 hypothetical protein HX448_07650 [Dehalogenimonas etheniformans]
MKEISLSVQYKVIRLFFQGCSYEEISIKTGVSLGKVSAICTDVRAGKYPETNDVVDEIDVLRELSIACKHLQATPAAALVGVIVNGKLAELNLLPKDLIDFHSAVKAFVEPGVDTPLLLKASENVVKLEKEQGQSLSDLMAYIEELKHEIVELGPIAEELSEKQDKLESIENETAHLKSEKSALHQEFETLKAKIKERKLVLVQLQNSETELEDRADSAMEKYNSIHEDLAQLANIGISIEELTIIRSKTREVALKHGIKPTELFSKMIDVLTKFDCWLDIEKEKNALLDDLQKTKQDILKAKATYNGWKGANQKLETQYNQWLLEIKSAKELLNKMMFTMNTAAQSAETKLVTSINAGIAKSLANFDKGLDGFKAGLNNALAASVEAFVQFKTGIDGCLANMDKVEVKAFEVGKDFGAIRAQITSTTWMNDLVSLLQGNALPEDKLRILMLTIFRPLLFSLATYNTKDVKDVCEIANLLKRRLELWESQETYAKKYNP